MRANLATASTSLVSEAQPVLLDLQTFLVLGKDLGRTPRARGSEAAFGMRQNFVQFSRGFHRPLSEQFRIANPKTKICARCATPHVYFSSGNWRRVGQRPLQNNSIF